MSYTYKKACPSLQELCLREVKKLHLNVRDVLELVECFEQIDWQITQGDKFRQECMDFIVQTYESLKRTAGESAIRNVLNGEVVDRLEQQIRETELAVRKIRITGRVLEREPAKESTEGAKSRKLVKSVSGKSSYGYEALKAGFKWPTDVNPSKREEHLAPDDFKKVFSFTFGEYKDLPQWKQLQLKKDKLLF